MKEQDKTSAKSLNKMGTSNLPDAYFKVLVMRMLNELGKIKDELSKNFNKETKNT